MAAALPGRARLLVGAECCVVPTVRGTVRELRRGRPGPPLHASPKSWRREYRARNASIQNLLQARKGTKGALHYQEIDGKAKPAGPGAMSSIALQLSRCWTTSLVVLLVTS